MNRQCLTHHICDCLAAKMAALEIVRDAALPFLNLKDRGEYVLGVITQSDITRLEEALEKVRG